MNRSQFFIFLNVFLTGVIVGILLYAFFYLEAVEYEASIGDDWKIIYEMEVWKNTEDHIPLYLVDRFPEALERRLGNCVNNDRVVGCFTGNAIYIINGTQGDRGADELGGCSILWHELKHFDGLDHYEMKRYYPNELCSAIHYPKDHCYQVFDPFCRR